jgi:hypothetical protein
MAGSSHTAEPEKYATEDPKAIEPLRQKTLAVDRRGTWPRSSCDERPFARPAPQPVQRERPGAELPCRSPFALRRLGLCHNTRHHAVSQKYSRRSALTDWRPGTETATLQAVQRLFSMFPSGSAGLSLVVLRCVVAATGFVHASAFWPMGAGFMVRAVAALVALCLCLGVLTPYCAAVSCVLELALLVAVGGPDRFQLGMSALTAAATAGLGPGAYSIDARLFGRKVFTIPLGRTSL